MRTIDTWPTVTVIYELVYCFGKVYIAINATSNNEEQKGNHRKS
jgi:hypothetical protein